MTAQSRRTTIATAGAGLLLGATFGLGGAHRPARRRDRAPPPRRSVSRSRRAAADHEVRLVIEERAGAPPGVPPAFYFEPTGLAIAPGQTVRFRALTPTTRSPPTTPSTSSRCASPPACPPSPPP